MSNEIFGVDIAATVNDAFAGNLHPITLYRISRTVDAYGEPVENAITHTGGEGVRGKWDTKTVIARGWPADTAKILMTQNGIEAPQKGDQVEILGERWRIIDIAQDPVNATWAIAGTLDSEQRP